MKKFFLIPVIFLISITLIPETQVSVSASSTHGTVGERINLKFIVKTTSGSDSIKIYPGKHEFEIIKKDSLSNNLNENLRTFERNFEISFFKTGDFNIGPFQIELSKGNSVTETLRTNTIPVRIKSVLEKGDDDIKPMKDLFEIKGNPLYLLKYLIFIAAIAALFFFLRFFISKRRRSPGIEQVSHLPPEDEFKKRIDSLWGSDLIKSGKAKIFFLSLTESYKNFLKRQYGFNAEDLTTYEIQIELNRYEKDNDISGNFSFVFLISDLTKFAKYEPSGDDLDRIHENLYRIIDFFREKRKKEEEEKKNVAL